MIDPTISKQELIRTLYHFLHIIYHFERKDISLFDVSWDELYLLSLLENNPGIPVSEAARMLKIRDFVSSRMISRLCREGLARRENSTGDRRVVKVYITEAGKKKLAEIDDYNCSVIKKALENIPEPEIRTLMSSINRLGDILGLEAK